MKYLIYVKKTKPLLYGNPFILKTEPDHWETRNNRCDYGCGNEPVNGKVIAEFDGETEEIHIVNFCELINVPWLDYLTDKLNAKELLSRSCLDYDELSDYVGGYVSPGEGYAIHINGLKIFDKPKDLSDYFTFTGASNNINNLKPVKKMVQNMMKVYEFKDDRTKCSNILLANYILKPYILISFDPESACQILNRIKTVDIKKKVLKEMKE